MKQVINWLPKILTSIAMWMGVVWMVLNVDPESVKDLVVEGTYLPMIMSVAVASWYTLLLLTKSFRSASALTTLLIISMVITVLHLMNIIVLIAIVGIGGFLGLTFTRKS